MLICGSTVFLVIILRRPDSRQYISINFLCNISCYLDVLDSSSMGYIFQSIIFYQLASAVDSCFVSVNFIGNTNCDKRVSLNQYTEFCDIIFYYFIINHFDVTMIRLALSSIDIVTV